MPSQARPRPDRALLKTRRMVAVKALATPTLAPTVVIASRILIGGGKGWGRGVESRWGRGGVGVAVTGALSARGVFSGSALAVGNTESAKRRVGTSPYIQESKTEHDCCPSKTRLYCKCTK